MFSEDELRELKAWRSRQAAFIFVLVFIVVPLAAFLLAMVVYEPDVQWHEVSLAGLTLAGLAAWIALRAPRNWQRARRDEAARLVSTVTGPVDVRTRPGFGFIAPTHMTLNIGGEAFALSAYWRAKLTPGLRYTVRYAPESRAILSITLKDAAGTSSHAERTGRVPPPDMSAREARLMRLLANGLTDKDIARQMNLSPATVRTYNSELYARLGIQRRSQVRPLAESFGLLDDPSAT